MTDSEFLDELQRRAAASIAPIISDGEWRHLERACNCDCRLAVVPAGRGAWAVSPGTLMIAVRLARNEMLATVTRRLKA